MSTTTNTHTPASARAHLVRSTRKLAHILGTTPSASLSSDSDTDSIKSFNSCRLPLRKKPSLFVSSPSSPRKSEFEVALSPLFTPSPSSPNFELSEKADKRRRFAKVCRTLGENVPPELVFGMPPTYGSDDKASLSSSPPRLGHRRRGMSVSHIISFSRNVESSRTSFVLADDDYSDKRPFCSPSPMMSLSDASSLASSDEDETNPSCVRGGPGWEGKWNRQSMGEIRMKLRKLK